MEKIQNKNRFIIELKSYGDYSSLDEKKEDLEKQVEELHYRVFNGEDPIHVIFCNEDNIEETSLFVYFYYDSDLQWIDQEFLEFSESFDGTILVTDFDNQLYQAYDCGEYDTGMFSQPEDKEIYEDGIKRLNDHQNGGGYPIILR